jgi:hypothetical protein
MVRFKVLIVISMSMTVLWDTAACSLVDTDVSEVLIAPIIRTVSTLETSVSIYQATCHNLKLHSVSIRLNATT